MPAAYISAMKRWHCEPDSPTAKRLRLEQSDYGGWKEVPGYPGLFVSSLGYKKHAYAVDRLKYPHLQNQNYLGYRRFKYKGKRLSMHWCVATAFLGPQPGPDYTVDHQIGDHGDDWFAQRGDNRVESLRWASKSEQVVNQSNRKTRRDSRPVFARHLNFDACTPSLWFETCGKAASVLGLSLSHAADVANRRKKRPQTKGWVIRWDDIDHRATGRHGRQSDWRNRDLEDLQRQYDGVIIRARNAENNARSLVGKIYANTKQRFRIRTNQKETLSSYCMRPVLWPKKTGRDSDRPHRPQQVQQQSKQPTTRHHPRKYAQQRHHTPHIESRLQKQVL